MLLLRKNSYPLAKCTNQREETNQMRKFFVLLTGWLIGLEGRGIGQSLQSALEDVEVGDHWIYNDLQAGIARARRENKPLFVVFRCVP